MQVHKRQALMLIAVIVLPLLIYAAMRIFTHPVFKPVRTYYDKNAQGDSTARVLPSFQLLDSEGKPFSKENMSGKIYLVNFFTSQGDSMVNTTLFGNLKESVYENADKADFIRLLSISITPKQDSLAYLKKLSEKLAVKAPKWTFATATQKEIWALAKEALKLPEFAGTDSTVVPFTARTVALVDGKGAVRGYYQMTNPGIGGGRTLQEDLRALLMTEFPEYKKHLK